MFGKSQKEDKLARYQDPTGEFPNRELKMAQWYVAHKLRLKKIGLGLLIAWCVATIGYSFSYWGYYFSFGYWQDQQMLARQVLEMENYDGLKYHYAPRDLILKNAAVYQSVSPELYDLVADAVNPNERWLAGVVYKFVYRGGETPLARTILLPGDSRPIAFFGHQSAGYPGGAQLVIEDIVWRKINAHAVPDVKAYLTERINFAVSDFVFTGASRLTGVPVHMIEFNLVNNSAYNYWEPGFYVELYDQSRVGLIYLTAEKFRAGEERKIGLRSLSDGLYASDIKVYPVINVFDRDEFMAAGAYVE